MSSNAKKSWYSIRALAPTAGATSKTAEVSIHDEIGLWGIRFADFARDIKALGDLDQITVSLNSPGGEVFDGLAIYNFLNGHKAHVTIRIEGLAASIASVIAMAGDEVQIPENALMMVHNPWGLTMGESEDMRKMADVLDKLRGSIVSAYRNKTGLEDAELIALMDEETWMNGRDAVDKGFADTVLDEVALAASVRGFDTRHFAKAPAIMKNSADTTAQTEQAASTETTSQQEGTNTGAAATATQATETTGTGTQETAETKAEGEEAAATATQATGTQASVNTPSLMQRLKAAFAGDPAIRAELETARATIATLTTERNTARDEITALKAQLTEFDAIKAALATAESTQQTATQIAAATVAAHGFTAERAAAELPTAAGDQGDILAHFDAITDPQERTKFYQANKAKLIAASDARRRAA